MRDYTTNEYCDFLWIGDMLNLTKTVSNEFRGVLKKSGIQKSITLKNVSFFGTIVQIKHIGEGGILYSVDDGTGVIVCKHNEQRYNEIADIIQSEQTKILNETFQKETMNDSNLSYTASDDSIFNDNTLQEEEIVALRRNRLKALHSIWNDIEDSFLDMVHILSIGDTVLVQGKLYCYLNVNQIYVNTIRKNYQFIPGIISVKEELILMSMKLEDGYEPIAKRVSLHQKIEQPPKVEVMENSRRSGLMTFDHIHHMETENVPAAKYIVSKNDNAAAPVAAGTVSDQKRESIVQPLLHGSVTFDTMLDLNESDSITNLDDR